VEKAGEDTLASKLGQILKKTTYFKTDLQSNGEKWADKIAMPLLCTSILSAPLLGFSRTMSILYCSPGNTIRICTSLLTLNHVTLASRKGILIKDGRALEELSKVDTVIFDKTGTLTEKQPKVGEIFSCNGYGKDSVLKYAATAEQKIAHPFAKAILDKAEESGLPMFELEDSEYCIGFGITALIDNNVVQTGSFRFMKAEGIAVPNKIMEMAESSHSSNRGRSLVMVAFNKQLIGAIEIQPQIRPEAKRIIRGLRHHGIKYISLVSGDYKYPTKQLAESLEADTYFYNVLPKNKADIVEQLQKKGRTVCFVGDGINDTIAMKKANVSVSLSGATDAATDVAQVLLMDGSLSHLCDIFDISKKLNANLRQTLIIGFGEGIFCIGSIFGLGLGFGSIMLILTPAIGVQIGHAMLPLKQIKGPE
jgi:Cu2+-exporting ATPase